LSNKEFNKKNVEECSLKCSQLIESKKKTILSFLGSLAYLDIYFYNKCESKKNSINLEKFKEFVKIYNFDGGNFNKNEILEKLSKLEKISIEDVEKSEGLMKIFNLYSEDSK